MNDIKFGDVVDSIIYSPEDKNVLGTLFHVGGLITLGVLLSPLLKKTASKTVSVVKDKMEKSANSSDVKKLEKGSL